MALNGKAAVPFSEPPYLSGIPSPYYKSTHLKFQKNCRQFLETNFLPYASKWDEDGRVPDEVFRAFAKVGVFVPTMVTPLPVEALKKVGLATIFGTPVEEFDNFHLLIFYDEIFRCGLTGPVNSMIGGFSIVSPYIIKFGSKQFQERFLLDLLSGKKRWCIALTEPRGGSDIANVSTTATKSADGKSYIINGEKKWITGGVFSDYTIAAVRTGGPNSGAAGLSIIVIPLNNTPGVTAERFYCTGQTSAGSTHFKFKDVQVPVENLLGQEGKGLTYILNGLNHERVAIAAGVARQARLALSTAFEYATERQAFNQLLIDQPVVRHKLAKVGAELESLWAWLEQTCYTKSTIPEGDLDAKIGHTAALIKAKAGMVFFKCGQAAVLIFGGLGYTRTGRGELVEKLYREIPGTRIPGGSEDVLLDSAIKQMSKKYRNALKKGNHRL